MGCLRLKITSVHVSRLTYLAVIASSSSEKWFYPVRLRLCTLSNSPAVAMAPSHPSMLSSENDDASLTERLVSKDLTPEELLRRLEIREMFKHHIEKPSPSLRTVFLLRIMHKRRANATARILRVPINTVKARLWRAINLPNG